MRLDNLKRSKSFLSYIKKQFIENEEGQGLIEYMLVISLIAIVVIIALTLFGQNLSDYWNNTTTKVTAPMGE